LSFIDTNVLVHATAEGAPFQAKARAALVGLAPSGGWLMIAHAKASNQG
jgi:predicted nucleic acid-binding protein